VAAAASAAMRLASTCSIMAVMGEVSFALSSPSTEER
jgi:hypothetical protein